jgi:hypothetical protein
MVAELLGIAAFPFFCLPFASKEGCSSGVEFIMAGGKAGVSGWGN